MNCRRWWDLVPFCRAAAAGGSALSPGRVTLLVFVELSGLGEVHPGGYLGAGNLQMQLEVRARGEDGWRTLSGYDKLACSHVTCQGNLSCLVPAGQASCSFTSAMKEETNKERSPLLRCSLEDVEMCLGAGLRWRERAYANTHVRTHPFSCNNILSSLVIYFPGCRCVKLRCNALQQPSPSSLQHSHNVSSRSSVKSSGTE